MQIVFPQQNENQVCKAGSLWSDGASVFMIVGGSGDRRALDLHTGHIYKMRDIAPYHQVAIDQINIDFTNYFTLPKARKDEFVKTTLGSIAIKGNTHRRCVLVLADDRNWYCLLSENEANLGHGLTQSQVDEFQKSGEPVLYLFNNTVTLTLKIGSRFTNKE